MQELKGEEPEGNDLSVDIESLKESIKREILEELRKERDESVTTVEEVRQELREEIRKEIQKKPKEHSPIHPQAVAKERHNFGNAEGRFLRRGVGLEGCGVKLVYLTGISSKFTAIKEGEEYLTATDKNGKYRFAAIPSGDYKIKWQLPNDTGWIRRLRDTPDAIVSHGKTSRLKDIETARPLVPR